MALFPKTFGLIRRGSGAYTAGVWTVAPEPDPVAMTANIQPARPAEYEMLQSMPGGRRTNNMLRCYADIQLAVAGDLDHPGDIVLVNGARYLVIGRIDRHALGIPTVSHYRYMLVPEIETVPGEVTA